MIDINIAVESPSLEKLDQEIEKRRNLQKQMVGTLYPGIVEDEIIRLIKRKVEIESLISLNYEYYIKKYPFYGKGRNH